MVVLIALQDLSVLLMSIIEVHALVAKVDTPLLRQVQQNVLFVLKTHIDTILLRI